MVAWSVTMEFLYPPCSSDPVCHGNHFSFATGYKSSSSYYIINITAIAIKLLINDFFCIMFYLVFNNTSAFSLFTLHELGMKSSLEIIKIITGSFILQSKGDIW